MLDPASSGRAPATRSPRTRSRSHPGPTPGRARPRPWRAGSRSAPSHRAGKATARPRPAGPAVRLDATAVGGHDAAVERAAQRVRVHRRAPSKSTLSSSKASHNVASDRSGPDADAVGVAGSRTRAPRPPTSTPSRPPPGASWRRTPDLHAPHLPRRGPAWLAVRCARHQPPSSYPQIGAWPSRRQALRALRSPHLASAHGHHTRS